jgi:hypothetical protein
MPLLGATVNYSCTPVRLRGIIIASEQQRQELLVLELTTTSNSGINFISR